MNLNKERKKTWKPGIVARSMKLISGSLTERNFKQKKILSVTFNLPFSFSVLFFRSLFSLVFFFLFGQSLTQTGFEMKKTYELNSNSFKQKIIWSERSLLVEKMMQKKVVFIVFLFFFLFLQFYLQLHKFTLPICC